MCSCTTLKNVSRSDPDFKHEIGKSICTISNLHLTQWKEDEVSYFQLEEYVLGRRNPNPKHDETMEDYMNSFSNKMFDFIPVPKATKFTVENVHYYSSISNSTYLVMASAADLPLQGKMVDISSIYSFWRPYVLESKHVEYCNKLLH